MIDIALGADGVLIGRPCVYGLATDGFLGAAKVMSILKDEFVQTMRLAGCRQLSDISVDFLREGDVADRRRLIIHDRS